MNLHFIIRHALEFSILFPAAFYALLPVRKHLRFRRSVVYGAAAVGILFMVVVGSLVCVGYDQFRYTNRVLLPAMLLYFVAYGTAVRLSIWQKVFCFANAAMLTGFCTMYAFFLCSPYEVYNENPASNIGTSLTALLLNLPVLTLFFRTLTVKIPFIIEDKPLERSWRRFCWLPVGLTVMTYWVTPVSAANVMVGRSRLIGLTIMPLIPATAFLMYHIFWWTAKRHIENAQMQQENNLLKMEQKRYLSFRSYMDSTKALRHDFRQHILVLNQLSAAGETEKLRDYLKDISDKVSVGVEHFCENTALDAIAAHYNELALSSGIKMDWDIEIPENIPWNEADLCALFGNLLENAVHAVQPLPPESRKITVISKMLSEAMLGISVENPYGGILVKNKEGLPVSLQSDHGIGLASVAATVHSYNGTLEINTDRQVFCVNIILYATLT